MHLAFTGDNDGFKDFATILEHILCFDCLHHFLSPHERKVLKNSILALYESFDYI